MLEIAALVFSIMVLGFSIWVFLGTCKMEKRVKRMWYQQFPKGNYKTGDKGGLM